MAAFESSLQSRLPVMLGIDAILTLLTVQDVGYTDPVLWNSVGIGRGIGIHIAVTDPEPTCVTYIWKG